MGQAIAGPDDKIIKSIIGMYFERPVIVLLRHISLSLAVGYKTNGYKMAGYLLSGTDKGFSAVVLEILLFSEVGAGYKQSTTVEANEAQVIKPASAVVGVETPGANDNISENLFYLLRCQIPTPTSTLRKRNSNHQTDRLPYRPGNDSFLPQEK